MFENQNTNPTGFAPGNLPISEPPDMLAGTDGPESALPPTAGDKAPSSSAEPSPAATVGESAVNAGKIKPVVRVPAGANAPADASEVSATPETDVPPVPPLAQPTEMYPTRGPVLSKSLITIVIVVVVVAIVGGGGWWIYNSFMAVDETDNIFTPIESTSDDTAADNGEQTGFIGDDTPDQGEEEKINDEVVDDRVLFGEPLDSDDDQLYDDLELSIGTNPNNWDSDGDELSDGDEVLIWDTDPLNPDSDGDGYKDGHEIKSGYDPKGEGKLLNPPTDIQ